MKLVLALLCFILALSGCGGSSCLSNPGESAITVLPQADAQAFRAKYESGATVGIAILGDSTTLWSDTAGFQTYLQLKNRDSFVYNFGVGGQKTQDPIAKNTISTIASLPNKPDAVFIALGINDVQYAVVGNEWEILVDETRKAGMLPVLVKENNIACPPTSEHESLIQQQGWLYFRWLVDKSAVDTNTEVIDLGTPDGVVDQSLLHDFLHPNAAGYAVILDKYKAWMNEP